MKHQVRVRLPDLTRRSYDIRIESGLLTELPDILIQEARTRSMFVLTDSNVARLYGRVLHRELTRRGAQAFLLDFPAGEMSKTLSVVSALHTALLQLNVRRESLVVALGGGVVGDVAGFVAATILRGLEYVHVPTTLLAQVDSSVGGKVGVDHALGKNLIGTFHQPKAVYIDPDVLRTLPAREFRSGLAEVVKIGAALDRSLFRFLERHSSPILTRTPAVLLEVICRAVSLKATVVQKDERESGLRKVLNLGHTIGHAIEAACNYRLRHGEAIAIGLAVEARIASTIGILSRGDEARLVRVLKTLGLPTSVPPSARRRKFFEALTLDKKSVGDTPKFVLLRRIGSSVVGIEVASTIIRDVTRGLR